MAVVIENPILNSAFAEPTRHFKFAEDGITDEIVESRRISSYFMPIAKSRKQGKQLALADWTEDRIEENKTVNRIRERVTRWRQGGYQGVTAVTRRLLEYWNDPERERKLFFCQIEALETAIYITEVAKKMGDAWIDNTLVEANNTCNPGLPRVAFKMATGTGKTVIGSMLIAYHCLNKTANPQDPKFSDTFLIVTPGITIKDRLRVLLPSDLGNYYKERDILPPDLFEKLGQAKIIITNFHSFKPREQGDASRLTKVILNQGEASPFTETMDQVVRRVCRELGNKKNIVIINDEAHHCYRRKPDGQEDVLTGDDRKEAEARNNEARVWLTGIEAVQAKMGVKAVYDLSATPFFLRGSGWSEGTLFPWVVSDFSLIDAIESGIVKVPRVPVSDDSMQGNEPTYRDLWLRIRDDLPKKGRKTDALSGEPNLPSELQAALHSLYDNYRKAYERWESNIQARERGQTPPVFIVVCNNTSVSKLVFDFVAGWEKKLKDGRTVPVPGNLPIFSNVDHGQWLERPNTILVDSEQLESGEAMSPEFKKIAAKEIEEFKAEYRARFPGRDAESLTDEDILREVMNTVGKAGKLGENVRCVVSVAMLTEGWDANTVTHILGVRAFGTQLLCEQVVGRGLRRMSYAINGEAKFEPEYAEVYGVPFSFIPCSGSNSDPKPGPIPTRVRALEDRIECEITFPRLLGYKYEITSDKLRYKFSADSKYALDTSAIPSKTENAPIVGESSIHTLDDLKNRRMNEVAFLIGKLVLEKYFRQEGDQKIERGKSHKFDSEVQSWLFPQVLDITKKWLQDCVTLKDNTFPQMLLLHELAHDAADNIYQAIVAGGREEGEEPKLVAILRPYDTIGSTRYVDFDTTRPVYRTRAEKCHISHVVADTDSWEQKMAETLEEMEEVRCYVKNQGLGYTIPYSLNGDEKNYVPDFIVKIDDGNGSDDRLNLVVEVSGQKLKEKAAKVATARNLWVPAVNNHGGLGRWMFIEISDPWDAKNTIRGLLTRNSLSKVANT